MSLLNSAYTRSSMTDWGLREHPEVREKIKRVLQQGHIDPEDFKGVCSATAAFLSVRPNLDIGSRDESSRPKGHSWPSQEGQA